MLTNYSFQNTHRAALALTALGLLLVGCAMNLPPSPALNPADSRAPEAASAPLQPSLLATSHPFLSPAADDREQAKQMEISQMKHRGSDMSAMQHQMPGMGPMPKGNPSLAAQGTHYTCQMHPQIHESKPGSCPICGMTLIKKSAAPEGVKP